MALSAGRPYEVKGLLKLEFTLKGLYAEAFGLQDEEFIFAPLFQSSEIKLTKNIDKSTFFIYHDPSINQNMTTESGRNLAIRYMALVAQRIAFHAGKMTCVLLLPEPLDANHEYAFRSFLEENLDVLLYTQRPKIEIITDIKSITRFLPPGSKCLSLIALDCLPKELSTTEPNILYELQTKQRLSLSGLPTPDTEIIEFKPDVGLAESQSKVIAKLQERELPFVFKLNQAYSGAGTHIVRTEGDRENLIQECETLLPKVFSKYTPENEELCPANLILQNFVGNEAGTFTVSFFVNQKNNVRFIGCTHQIAFHDARHGSVYQGSVIFYDQFERNAQQVQPILTEVSVWLRRDYRYYGACGIDMVKEPGDNGRMLIVDLNVRPPSSMILGLLKEHFTRKNFMVACLLPEVRTRMTRGLFNEHFRAEFVDERIVITAFFNDTVLSCSWMSLVLAGEDLDRVEQLKKRVGEIEIKEKEE